MARRGVSEDNASLTLGMYHILLALARGERHGYGIMREVATLSDGAVRLGPGTLYRVLREMLDAGLIVESDERPDPAHDDERRRYYALTDAGRRAALAETRRLARLVESAREAPGLDFGGELPGQPGVLEGR
jgi:DNA-binding PadR family transcriptional regulator